VKKWPEKTANKQLMDFELRPTKQVHVVLPSREFLAKNSANIILQAAYSLNRALR